MKFTPANIANLLKRNGIPISKWDKHVSISGVHVTSWNHSIFFEYQVWSKGDQSICREQGIQNVIEVLIRNRYTATERIVNGKGTGIFRIHNL